MITHVDKDGRPTMVDVSAKEPSLRTAHARTTVRLPSHVAEALLASGAVTKKGPVFDTAIVAGVMAAKKTHELVPFCHPLGIEKCKVSVDFDPSRTTDVVIDCRVAVHHRTGVEMEALTGASVAALTVYDMCKALSHDIVIGETRLIEKTGGKSDYHSTESAA
jgi:cyclic pyranopterin phosphate synthase